MENRKPLNFAQALRSKPGRPPEPDADAHKVESSAPTESSPDSLSAPGSLSVADSQSASDRPPVPARLSAPVSLPAESRLSPDAIAYPPDSQSAPDSLPAPDSRRPDLWAPFKDKRGHLRQPHAYTDGLCQVLDVYEQAIYTQLYRLSHGYGKPTCKIGLPQLARRANMGKTTTQATVNRLIDKGLVRKLEYEIGRNKEQGTTYWISSPDSQPATDSLPGGDTIKVKALKEKSKREGSHERKDYSACPDCLGSGMWYPGGFEKGVAKCRHAKLRATE
jgi:hypothetical protein